MGENQSDRTRHGRHRDKASAADWELSGTTVLSKVIEPTSRTHLLFVCSRNEWRSRTAETIWKRDDRFVVRSAGTSARARVRVTQALLDWADLIFVMEDRHREQLIQRFGRAAYLDALIVLDIPDVYRYMDPELVAELRDTVTVCLP